MNTDNSQIKPIIWVGSSHRDLTAFPREVQKDIGYALWLAQTGGKHDKTKPLKGFSGVMEIISDQLTDAYRAVYTVKMGASLYVLHAFQKKSRRGRTTPRQEMDMIRRRLQEARKLMREEE